MKHLISYLYYFQKITFGCIEDYACSLFPSSVMW